MPKTSTPDLEGLAKFSRTNERTLTPFFVGRENEIAAIEAVCADALKRAHRGDKGHRRRW